MAKYIQCVNNSNKLVTPEETIRAIKNAGFEGVFLQWYNKDWEFFQEKQLKLCRELGLDVEFVHLGYKGINKIWESGEEGEILVQNYLKDLDVCRANNINLVIMHLTSHSIAPKPSLIGINRFQKIVDYAEKLNIKVAFENTKIWGYLEYVFEHIKNPNAGVCFDSGHYHAHFNDNYSWERFKDKIFALHLHDNDKTDDLHLLPFDGTLDWIDITSKIKQSNYNGPVTLESCYRYDYLNLSVEEFYKQALERAKQLNL